MSRLEHLAYPWLAKAEQEYRPIRPNIAQTETSFLRGEALINVLDNEANRIPSDPNILMLGLGYDDLVVLGSLAPIRVAGHLEGSGRQYKMTLIDQLAEAAESIQRDRVFIEQGFGPPKFQANVSRAWEKYVQDTGQQGSITHELEPELLFNPIIDRVPIGTHSTDYLRLGVHKARVPESFAEKRKNGDVNVVLGDAVTTSLGRDGQYDACDTTNLFIYVPKAGQMLLMDSISRVLAIGARLVTTDSTIGQTLMAENGGWLDVEKRKQLGLELEDAPYLAKSYHVLRKVEKVHR